MFGRVIVNGAVATSTLLAQSTGGLECCRKQVAGPDTNAVDYGMKRGECQNRSCLSVRNVWLSRRHPEGGY